ncbi:MFS transporter [Rhizobium sp. 57MFTsu3.2]|uniref:MFS transporter n=1 Tax=Rhizobium sp. 57MFTsu3.2 TaxID=1048681 RepID=UPI00146AC8CF|nr:MFS transporter [Rhizobium sp. 57MFTsu3.2]NMN70919.1 putative MFS family arabinose efflux permease [Rhizobium sp. 57MFTsu3.2]
MNKEIFKNVTQQQELRGWGGVWSLCFGTFALVSSELAPIAALPVIARDYAIDAGSVGLAVTLPALAAAIAAPLFCWSQADRKTLLLAMMLLTFVADMVGAFSGGLTLLLLGRLVLGVSIGGFWSIGATSAARLVPQHLKGRAIAIVFGGASAGSVIGLPLASAIIQAQSWRAALLVFGTIAISIALAQLFLLPKLQPQNKFHYSSLWELLRMPNFAEGLAATSLLISGHFIAYTFLASLIGELQVPNGISPWAFFAFGCAGLISNTISGEYVQTYFRQMALLYSLLLGLSLLALTLTHSSLVAAFSIIVWGIAFGGIPICLQVWLLTAAQDRREISGAAFVSVFQISIAVGALAGGFLNERFSIQGNMVAGCALAGTTAALIVIGRIAKRLSGELSRS